MPSITKKSKKKTELGGANNEAAAALELQEERKLTKKGKQLYFSGELRRDPIFDEQPEEELVVTKQEMARIGFNNSQSLEALKRSITSPPTREERKQM